MTCLGEDESCLDILESQENLTSPNAHYQMKAMMHKWQHPTGAEVEHNHPQGQSKRMPLWSRADKDAVSLQTLPSLLR
jgi:hypothetical protein